MPDAVARVPALASSLQDAPFRSSLPDQPVAARADRDDFPPPVTLSALGGDCPLAGSPVGTESAAISHGSPSLRLISTVL
jgi:hypothetical protein